MAEMPPTGKFPWDAAMAFGFEVMRLSPAVFWAMTPRELGAAMRAFGHGVHAPPGRGEMESLMQAFPDRPQGHSGIGKRRS